MVSSAIACLDQQEKDLLDGSHPQLLWLWQELERRKEAQYLWAEAREQADEDQLLKMCDHWKRCARFNFHVGANDFNHGDNADRKIGEVGRNC